MKGFFQKCASYTGLGKVFMAAAIALPLTAAGFGPAEAQELSVESKIELCSDNTCLAYIQTGNRSVDSMTEAGLYGLSHELYERTNVENMQVQGADDELAPNILATGQVIPMAVDPAVDDLSLYPIIFWSVDPSQPQMSEEALESLNSYMTNGGLLFIDTRDQSTFNRGKARLRQAVDNGLDVPPLRQVEGCESAENDCDVLSKSFFLLQEFPGRYMGSGLWAERIDGEFNHDGVPRVIIGGNEWVGAWAKDASGRHMFPVFGTDPEQREHAYRVGINLIMYALTGNYKGDQVHIPFILERMGGNAPN